MKSCRAFASNVSTPVCVRRVQFISVCLCVYNGTWGATAMHADERHQIGPVKDYRSTVQYRFVRRLNGIGRPLSHAKMAGSNSQRSLIVIFDNALRCVILSPSFMLAHNSAAHVICVHRIRIYLGCSSLLPSIQLWFARKISHREQKCIKRFCRTWGHTDVHVLKYIRTVIVRLSLYCWLCVLYILHTRYPRGAAQQTTWTWKTQIQKIQKQERNRRMYSFAEDFDDDVIALGVRIYIFTRS